MSRIFTKHNAALVAGIGLAILAIAAAAFGAGCADPITNARRVVLTAAQVESEAAQGLVKYDKDHQDGIVAAAKTKADAEAQLAAYRAKRAVAVKALESVWLGIVSTETAINLAEAGQKNPSDLAGYVNALLPTLSQLTGALQQLGVPIPSL